MILKRNSVQKCSVQEKFQFPSPCATIVASFLHIINRKPYTCKSKHGWVFSPLNSNHETIELKNTL